MSIDLDSPAAIKDEDAEHPIPGALRQALREVVRALVAGDYTLSKGITGVERVAAGGSRTDEELHR